MGVAVLVLFALILVFVVLAVGLLAVYFHPTWFSFLRHAAPTPHALGALAGRFSR